MSSSRASEAAFFAVSAVCFAASATATVVSQGSMSAMGEMPMAGGWTMSMAWMRMPGQTWTAAAVAFLGMWAAMMPAMMLPSLVPMLGRYRQRIGETGDARRGRWSVLAGAGYFSVWVTLGVAVFPLGLALAAVEMRQPVLARAVPIAGGVLVLLAGFLQFTPWKSRQLARCREAPRVDRMEQSGPSMAWRHGVRLGIGCVRSCFNLMVIFLVIGVMDLRAMAVVGTAIAAERLARSGAHIARVSGAVAVGAGLLLIARASLA